MIATAKRPRSRTIKSVTAAVLAAATIPGAFVVITAAPAEADVCANVGRRVSVGGCANLADAIAPYAPPPAAYAPLPGDPPPPPAYVPPPPPPPPNINACVNVGRRIHISGCL